MPSPRSPLFPNRLRFLRGSSRKLLLYLEPIRHGKPRKALLPLVKKKSKKLPAIQFYPGDWRKDPGVQALSYHDRGIWFEILLLMFESSQRGKLLLNGRAMPAEALARLLGLDEQVLAQTLTRLIEFGVASQDKDTGAMICRRMVRDDKLTKIRKKSGSLGGNPALLNQKPKQKTTTQDNQKPTPSSSSSVSTSSSDRSRSIDLSRPAIPNLEEARQWARELSAPQDCADVWWNEMVGVGWIDVRGRPVTHALPAFTAYATKWKSNSLRHQTQAPPGPPTPAVNKPGRYS